MKEKESMKRNSCGEQFARYCTEVKRLPFRYICALAFLFMVVFSAIMTVGSGTVYAETVTGAQDENDSVVTSTDDVSAVDTMQTGDIDLSGIYEIGGYAEEEESQEDTASIAAASSNFKYEAKVANSLKSFKKNISVSGMGVTRSNVASIFANIMSLHPEIVYIANVSYMYDSRTNVVSSLVVGYIPNAKKVKSTLVSAINEVNKQINTKNMKPEEIVLAYHEYLTANVEYDASGIRDYSTVYGRDHKYDMYGALVDKKAVCQGYAETMQYFLKRAGVPCALATSVYINHAWNVVKINGKWYHVDTTWDDPTPNLPGRSGHSFFLVSESTLNTLTKKMNPKYPRGRYDMKISGVWNQRAGNYTKTSDTRYEKGQMWSGVEKVMYYRKGYWYSIKKGSSAFDFQILRNKYSTGDKKVILSGQSAWYNTDGSVNNGQYGSIFLAQEYLYFNTARYIGRIDLESSKYDYSLLYDMRKLYSEGINIYAMGWSNKKVVVWVSNSPSCTVRDAYLLDPCLKHNWNSGKVTKKATYKQTGTKEYICKKCSYKKKVSIPKLKLGKTKIRTTAVAKGIKLSWTKVSGASGYRIYKQNGKGGYRFVRSVQRTYLVDSKVSSGVTYKYKVVAYNRYTTGSGAVVSRCYTGNVKAKAHSKTGGVKITWNKVKGANSYRVYRKTKSSSYKLMKTVNSRTSSWIDRRAVNGKKYTYAVIPYRKKVPGSYTSRTIQYRKPR